MRLLRTLLLFISIAIIGSCARDKEFPGPKSYPVLRTIAAEPELDGVLVSGMIASNEGAAIIEYGFTYTGISKGNNMAIKKIVGTSSYIGNFKAKLNTDILKGEEYIVQSYANNGDYIVYGNKIHFTGKGSSSPIISGFSPTEGIDETIITIKGENFSHYINRVLITLGNRKAEIIEVNPNTILARVPVLDLGSHPLTVSILDKTVKSTAEFTLLVPTITHISADRGIPGDKLHIYGTNLATVNRAYIGGTDAKIVTHTDNEVIVKVPFALSKIIDMPVNVAVYTQYRSAILLNSYTILSVLKQVSELPLNLRGQQTPMPSFVIGDKAYFFSFDRLISYSVSTGTWKNEGNFPGTGRHYPIIEQIGNKVYLIGGDNNYKEGFYSIYQYYKDVWEYDHITNVWTRKGDLPFKFSRATSFVLENKIYFFGAQYSSADLTVWKYNPLTENLTALKPFPENSTFGSSFKSNGIIYVVKANTFWEYNAQQDSWISKGATPNALMYEYNKPYAFAHKGKGYVISSTEMGNIISRYETSENRWVNIGQFPDCVNNNSFSGFSTAEKLYIGSFGNCSNKLYSYQEK